MEELFTEEKRTVLSRRDARSFAFHVVYAVDRFNYAPSVEEMVEQFCKKYNIELADGGYALNLAYGATAYRKTLDRLIEPHLKNWKLERLEVSTRLILRMAIWELAQKDALPSVIINEAIELAKAFAEKDAYKFINGILDTICRTNVLENMEFFSKPKGVQPS